MKPWLGGVPYIYIYIKIYRNIWDLGFDSPISVVLFLFKGHLWGVGPSENEAVKLVPLVPSMVYGGIFTNGWCINSRGY